eukprot:TRINITY_DN9883_c0_g1_i1.p1 TRINITY_DN9883_c0_g1~~TRINITY_DN9883_c0_g1_i1.p1  ORF type:complete len:339 (-),score=68.61 TRINITY_DN9883_c0_g1_i1:234-1250(-)
MRSIRMMSVVVLFILTICPFFSLAHPPVSFYPALGPIKDLTTGKDFNLTFTLHDMLHNLTLVNFTQLVPYHGRYMHILIGSKDIKTAFHLHFEDFFDPTTTFTNETYHIPINLPKSGLWYIGMSFMANITGTLREGTALGSIFINTPPIMDYPDWTTLNYTTTNKFKAYSIGTNDSYPYAIDTDSNLDPNGYTVSIKSVSGRPMNQILSLQCQPYYLEIIAPDGSPVSNFVPFLDAPMHASFVSDTIYHGHGTFLTNKVTNLQELEDYTEMMSKMMNGHGMMTMDMSDDDMALYMGALMMGVQPNHVINCSSDMGQIMAQYNMSPYSHHFFIKFDIWK